MPAAAAAHTNIDVEQALPVKNLKRNIIICFTSYICEMFALIILMENAHLTSFLLNTRSNMKEVCADGFIIFKLIPQYGGTESLPLGIRLCIANPKLVYLHFNQPPRSVQNSLGERESCYQAHLEQSL